MNLIISYLIKKNKRDKLIKQLKINKNDIK